MTIALALIASYLLGAIPFGFVLARLVKGVDLRRVGSGNIGATNAGRVLGKPLGLLAFALDFAKGGVAVWVFAPLAGDAGAPLVVPVACGAAAVLGHCFPVYLGFKGGKGVATACGAVFALDWLVFVIAGAVWLFVAFTWRFVSMASLAMGIAFPIAAYLRRPDAPVFALGCAGLATLIVVRHRPNLARVKAGTEPRLGDRKRTPASPPTGEESHVAR